MLFSDCQTLAMQVQYLLFGINVRMLLKLFFSLCFKNSIRLVEPGSVPDVPVPEEDYQMLLWLLTSYCPNDSSFFHSWTVSVEKSGRREHQRHLDPHSLFFHTSFSTPFSLSFSKPVSKRRRSSGNSLADQWVIFFGGVLNFVGAWALPNAAPPPRLQSNSWLTKPLKNRKWL